MKCRILALCLAGCVLLSPLSASPEPSPSSSGVWLSDAEAAEQAAAMEAADKAIADLSERVKTQEQNYKKLSLLCGLLGVALVVDAAAHVIVAIKD